MSEPLPEKPSQKPLVGIIAGLCLAVSLATWFFAPERDAMMAAFLRVGLVMSALWLAMPSKGESIAWAKATPIIGIVIAVVALSRNAAKFVLPALLVAGVAIAILRPRPKRRSGSGR